MNLQKIIKTPFARYGNVFAIDTGLFVLEKEIENGGCTKNLSGNFHLTVASLTARAQSLSEKGFAARSGAVNGVDLIMGQPEYGEPFASDPGPSI